MAAPFPESPRLAAALALLALAACGGPAPAPPEIPEGFAPDAKVAALLDERHAAAAAAPGDAAMHLELGLALSVNDGTELAETCFRNALAIEPSNAEARYQLSRMRAELGAMDDQIAELRRVLEVQSDFHAARYDLACALLDEGRYDEARGEFDTLLIQVPDAPLVEMGIGLVEVERGEALKGIPHLIKAFEAYPREGFIRFRLGQAYREIGQDRKADQLMEGLDGASGRPVISSAGTRRAKSFEVGGNARLSRANAHLNAGEAARAVVILEPLVAASPEDFSAGMSLVAGYIELKRTEEAMTLIERMASLRPENHLPMVQRATGLLQLADACREAGDGVGAQRALRDALASADSAVAAEPEFPTGHLRRAAALAGLRRDDEALGAYRRAVALGETSERVYQQMMGPAERSKGLSEVERLLKEGISKGVDRFVLRFELCGVYMRSGRGRQARAEQREMARRSANHPLTRRADQILGAAGL